MTQEEKELLIKDLSIRLPYKIKASYYGTDEEMECTDVVEGIIINNNDAEIIIGQYGLSVEKVKPYLFPFSSMTEEQYNDFFVYFHNVEMNEVKISGDYLKAAYLGESAKRDWLNKNHFDYNYLIEKGIVLDATGLNIY